MKLRNKLILSCAALAAVATTAASTTFAWYTSNTEVQAGTITAVTKNSGADLLMIADGLTNKDANGDYIANVAKVDVDKLNWGTSVSQVTYAGTVNTTNGTITAPELLPLAYNGTNAAADSYGAAPTQPTAETFGNATYYVVEGTGYKQATEFDATVASANGYFVKSSTLNATGGKLVNLVENYKKTADEDVVAGKTYYTLSGSTYSKVQTPVKADLGNYYEASMVTPTAADTAEGASYLSFVLYLKNAGTGTKDLTMTISNLTNSKTDNLPSKSIIDPANNAALMGRTAANTNYTVDAFRVAALDLEVRSVTSGVLSDTLVDETVYSLKSANASYTFNDNTAGALANGAHLYYNNIMETPLKLDDTYNKDTSDFATLAGGTKIKVKLPAAATADNSLELTFKVFLNGWDKWCFDACQNQTLTFDLAFNV